MVESEEWFHGKEGGEDETSDGDFGVKKHFLGVDKQGNRWRARARNSLLRTDVYLGCYDTPEEAALVAKKKRDEFEEMLKRQESLSMGTCRGYFEGKKFHGKKGVDIETRDGVSGVKKRFLGVDKQGNRWRARARNPLLRVDVHLGCYGTPEEAALVAKKKREEFEKMLERRENSSMGACMGYFEGKKLTWGRGVRRQNRRNRVHIRHLKSKNWVSGGSHRASEDAAIVANKKRKEFQDMYGGKVGKLRDMSGDANVPYGVQRTQSGAWVARIKMPKSKDRNWFGIYNTLEEAIGSFNKKKAEFDAKQKKPEFDCTESRSGSESSESALKEGGEDETSDGDFCVKKHFLGVDKQGNRWRARARNTLLRTDVYLGCYGTPEEAALVAKKKRAEFEELYGGEVRKLRVMSGDANVLPGVMRRHSCKWVARIKKPESKKKKKAEFEEMFKGQESSRMGTCRGCFEGKKLPGGVRKKKRAKFEEMFEGSDSSSMGTSRGYFEGKKLPGGWGVRRNRVHIRHQSQNWASGGSYRACEDAAIVADKKREEFQEMYRGEVGKLSVLGGDAKVPPVVKRIQSGEWVARIKKPESKDRILLGIYNTLEEAVSSYNKKKAEFDAKKKRPEFDCAYFRPGSEASETQMQFQNELGDDHPTSLLSADNLYNVALDHYSTNDCEVVAFPGSLGDGLVHGFPTSAFDPKNKSTASVGDKTFDSEFDRALSLGIINDYGQLLGKYGEFDTHTWLSPA